MTYSVAMSEPVVNPLLEFRLAQEQTSGSNIGWSLDQTSREMGVAVSTIIRTEQGCYNEIPPAILRHLITFFISADSVRDQYSRFKTGKRTAIRDHRAVERQFAWKLKTYVQRHPETNPFLIWRYQIAEYKSRLAFCKDFCLHPSTVKRVEDGVAEKIPESILEAMHEIWLDPDSIETLEKEYANWRGNR